MVTRADGKKKSKFLAQTSVLSGSYFDYVVSGTNYRISYDNLLAGLDIRSKVQQGGLLSMQNNATATTIAAIATPVRVAGVWTSVSADSMTASTSGRLTYDLSDSRVLSIGADLTIDPAAGTSQSVSVYIALNGAVIDGSRISTTISTGAPQSLSTQWRIAFTLADYVEVFVQNATATNNLVVSRAVLRVN